MGPLWGCRNQCGADSYGSCARLVASAPRQHTARIGVISRCWLPAPEGLAQRLHADRNGLVPPLPGAQTCAVCGSARAFVLLCFRECVFVVLAELRGWGKTRRRAGLVGLCWPTRTLPPRSGACGSVSVLLHMLFGVHRFSICQKRLDTCETTLRIADRTELDLIVYLAKPDV